MRRTKELKKIPFFRSEVEESRFWDKVDSTLYFSGKGGIRLRLPSRTTTISIRLPDKLLMRLRRLAKTQDVPYQSLMKIYLDEKVREGITALKKVA